MKSIEVLTLHDGKEYAFDDKQTWLVKTVREVENADYKTAWSNNQCAIPANTVLKVNDVIYNYYGKWVSAYYNGSHYYISPSDLEYVEGGKHKIC